MYPPVHCIHVYTRINFVDNLPTINELQIFKYTDKGKKNNIRIFNSASHKWKNIASLICNDANFVHELEERFHGDPTECLIRLFSDYFIRKKPRRYSQNWNGLIELLNDVGLESLARELRYALSLESGDQHHKVSIHLSRVLHIHMKHHRAKTLACCKAT
jgi:hypothetical protein